VWLEVVPPTHVAWLRWTPSLERWEIGLDLYVDGDRRPGMRVQVKLSVNGTVIADDTYALVAGEVHRRIALSDPGIDDYRNELLWSPARPTLIDAEIKLWAGRGDCMDSVRSYTALRQVGTQGDRFLLNGRPYTLRMVLDQGYWAHTGLTAPSDAALRHDVELAKLMGFNGVRKHQKIEDPRYLFWADRLGSSCGARCRAPTASRTAPSSASRGSGRRRWAATRATRASWRGCRSTRAGACPTCPRSRAAPLGAGALPPHPHARHHAPGDRQRRLGERRDRHPRHPRLRPQARPHRAALPQRRRAAAHPRAGAPGGRRLVVEGHAEHTNLPVMLTEFGGMAYHPDPARTWGYSRCETVADLHKRYHALLESVNRVALFAGFCYTQFTDTYQEANGLLTMDREPKIPLAVIREATLGEPEPLPGSVPGVEIGGAHDPLHGVLYAMGAGASENGADHDPALDVAAAGVRNGWHRYAPASVPEGRTGTRP
jgi:hypothetical protein